MIGQDELVHLHISLLCVEQRSLLQAIWVRCLILELIDRVPLGSQQCLFALFQPLQVGHVLALGTLRILHLHSVMHLQLGILELH